MTTFEVHVIFTADAEDYQGARGIVFDLLLERWPDGFAIEDPPGAGVWHAPEESSRRRNLSDHVIRHIDGNPRNNDVDNPRVKMAPSIDANGNPGRRWDSDTGRWIYPGEEDY